MVDKKKSAPKRRAAPKPKKVIAPSPEQVAEARRARKAARADNLFKAGTVYGLDEKEWASALIDPDLAPGQIERHRRTYVARGWIELEGVHAVSGYPVGAIVFVKSQSDYKRDFADMAARRKAKRDRGAGFQTDTL